MLNREKFLEQLGDYGKCSDLIGKLNIDIMLCDMVESALQFQLYANKRGKKFAINLHYANMLIKTIESATGRKWQEVQKIVKECME